MVSTKTEFVLWKIYMYVFFLSAATIYYICSSLDIHACADLSTDIVVNILLQKNVVILSL